MCRIILPPHVVEASIALSLPTLTPDWNLSWCFSVPAQLQELPLSRGCISLILTPDSAGNQCPDSSWAILLTLNPRQIHSQISAPKPVTWCIFDPTCFIFINPSVQCKRYQYKRYPFPLGKGKDGATHFKCIAKYDLAPQEAVWPADALTMLWYQTASSVDKEEVWPHEGNL